MQNPENPKGVIFDAGYRRYEGRYLGRASAIASLVWDDFKRSLGVKRSLFFRIGIVLMLLIQLGISLFYLFSSQFIEQAFQQSGAPAELANPFSSFIDTTSLFGLILVAMVAPYLLCKDRKNNVFPLYMVRPIYLQDYIIAKGLSIFLVLAVFILAPALLIFIGKAFLAPNALQYFADNQTSFGAMMLSGLLIAAFFTTYSMGISSLTTGVGVAAGMIVGLDFLLGIVSSILFRINKDPTVALIAIEESVFRIKDWIFFGKVPSISASVDGTGRNIIQIEALPVWMYISVMLLVIVGSLIITFLAYRREAQR
ncbi:hypothetical protein HY229_02180 [Candidatus Acetothermia bacterium]|nr:hypothetical protein [Candidatus Acetothermia bacterium]MBI3642896.1 hypothetical protein [Candidatus Acetothermia bacterium]